jgi:hypothetical protein
VSTTKKKDPSRAKFPTLELNLWLEGHKTWNHADWLELLTELRKKGYGHLTDSVDGHNAIGQYLEKKRS